MLWLLLLGIAAGAIQSRPFELYHPLSFSKIVAVNGDKLNIVNAVDALQGDMDTLFTQKGTKITTSKNKGKICNLSVFSSVMEVCRFVNFNTDWVVEVADATTDKVIIRNGDGTKCIGFKDYLNRPQIDLLEVDCNATYKTIFVLHYFGDPLPPKHPLFTGSSIFGQKTAANAFLPLQPPFFYNDIHAF